MKLKGFTILEVVLSMAISGLVLGIGVTGYFMAKGQFARYQSKSKEWATIHQFQYILKRDVAQAIMLSHAGDVLQCKSEIKGNVEYNFRTSYVLRTNNQQSDTFHLSISNLNFEELQGANAVTSLEFETELNGNPLQFYQYKEYAADLLLNIENGH